MNWNPHMLAHYTWGQVIVSWTIILPIIIVNFMFLVATIDPLITLAMRCCYNAEANAVKRFITLTVVCPAFVLIMHTINMLMLGYFMVIIIDECLTVRKRN